MTAWEPARETMAPGRAGAEICGSEVAAFAALLADMGSTPAAGVPADRFYGRLAAAFCRLAAMERAVLFRYDDVRRRFRPAGSHGVELTDAGESCDCGLDSAPLARAALIDDRVSVLDIDLEPSVPEWARRLGVRTLVCTPLSTPGRCLGLIVADRGGGRFELTEPDRDALWMLGKMTALAASAELAVRHEEREREVADRLGRGREIHEGVMQRLFAVKLVLSGDDELSPAQRERCIEELHSAHGELREIVSRPAAPLLRRRGGTSLRGDLAQVRRHCRCRRFHVDWPSGLVVPAAVEPLAQWVLAEAIANIEKHARPSTVEVKLWREQGAFLLEIVNDGVEESAGPSGAGLRLAELEAVRHGAVLESGLVEPGVWRLRLEVPAEALP